MNLTKVPFLLSFLMPGLALAQDNRHLYFTDTAWAGVNAATRLGAASTADIECLVDFAAQIGRGIGATTKTTCTVSGQNFVIQDQERLTQDNYKIVYRRATAPDGPADTTAAGVIAITANIQLPTPPPSTSGVIAWNMTITWTTPVTIPCEAGLYAGLELLPGASATDFTYIQTANNFTVGAPSTGDNPRVPTPKFFSASVTQPAAVFARSTSQRTLAFNLLAKTPTLNVGNIDSTQANYKSYGLGGTYPAIKSAPRDDGLTVRVQDESTIGGIGGLFVSLGYLPGGFDLGGVFTGTVWMNPGPMVSLGGFSLPAATPIATETTVAPPGAIPAAVGTLLVFQAVTTSPSFTSVRLSNAQASIL
jgi:hypothetical protein